MKINIEPRRNPNIEKYHKQDLDVAFKFAKEAEKELGDFVKAIIIFGSTTRKRVTESYDIDILMVLDDITINFNRDLVGTYRIIIEKLVAKIDTRLHITTLRFTSFWDYVRNGDPIAINMLRDGLAIIDRGFFEPLQILLRKGRIRPTYESIWSYYVRAPNTLKNSKAHILQATVDLYWAVIDSAHAALMKIGEIPPTPSHVADLIDQKMVKKGLLEKKYAVTMRKLYDLSKKISHQVIDNIKGKDYDLYVKEADAFVRRMKDFIEAK